MTDTDRQELRYRLATKVMGWTIPKDDNPRLTPHWFLNEAGKRGMRLKDFTPDLPTPQGFYQCFGSGGLVERVEDKGLYFDVDNGWETPNYQAEFATKDQIDKGTVTSYAVAPTITLAICLAADKAMEGK